MIRQLGQGLGFCNADTDRNADPLADLPAHRLCISHKVVMAEPLETQKAFVDAVDLLVRGILRQHRHHPVAHVGVECIVAAQSDDAVLPSEILHLEPWRAHFHAEGLDLVATGDGATIVVGEHDHRLAFQSGIEDSLTGDIEVVAVDQSNCPVHRCRHSHGGMGLGSAQRPMRRLCASASAFEY